MSAPPETQPGVTGYEWYWRGTVDQTLTTIRSQLDVLVHATETAKTETQEWRRRTEERLIMLEAWKTDTDADSSVSAKVNDEKYVTWSYIRDRFLVPILLGALTYLLLSLLPQVIGHLGTP